MDALRFAAMSRNTTLPGVGAALLSAVLFGLTTPIAKQLLSAASPLLIAGLLYAGSGIGVSLMRVVQDRGWSATALSRSDWPWLAAATLVGGVVAPALLMLGLKNADAAAASLLLNLEVVFTALLAWLVFTEPTTRRVVAGLLIIFVGGLTLVWPDRLGTRTSSAPLLQIIGACLCWAVDTNLTRRISGGDARLIAAVKGLAAGGTNIALAFALGASLPSIPYVTGALILGFAGYGLSLVLFIVALRNLGAARASAYSATGPFIGAAIAVVLYGQPGSLGFWLAALCMGVGVWLHVTESHAHDHVHERLTHSHSHSHDTHHRHPHDTGINSAEPHSHEHRHDSLRHSHPHFPDIHHQHRH
jgi:drug/metabolite transporter (DMT)-like permease